VKRNHVVVRVCVIWGVGDLPWVGGPPVGGQAPVHSCIIRAEEVDTPHPDDVGVSRVHSDDIVIPALVEELGTPRAEAGGSSVGKERVGQQKGIQRRRIGVGHLRGPIHIPRGRIAIRGAKDLVQAVFVIAAAFYAGGEGVDDLRVGGGNRQRGAPHVGLGQLLRECGCGHARIQAAIHRRLLEGATGGEQDIGRKDVCTDGEVQAAAADNKHGVALAHRLMNHAPACSAISGTHYAAAGGGVNPAGVTRADDNVVDVVEIGIVGGGRQLSPIRSLISRLENPVAAHLVDVEETLTGTGVDDAGVAGIHRHRVDR
jgi:hypothetical protein